MQIKTMNQNFMAEKDNKEPEVKVIRRSSVARQILKAGWEKVKVRDIKPDRDYPERSCVVFVNDDAFQEVFSQVLEEIKRNRESNAAKEISDLKAQVAELKNMLESKEG